MAETGNVTGKSLNKIGIVKAHCGGTNYVTIGTIFQDLEDKLVIKIDSLPLGASGWTGWINVFEDKDSKFAKPSAHNLFPERQGNLIPRAVAEGDDDFPF